MTYYDDIADSYNELHGEEQKRKLEIIKKELSIKKEFRLLDVGCGTGISSDFDCEVHGIDPSKQLLDQAPLAHKKVACAEEIPYPNEYFDIVLCITALQNFTNLSKGIDEISRVSKQITIISFLKKSSRKNEFFEEINKRFIVDKEIDEGKDLILFLSKKRQ